MADHFAVLLNGIVLHPDQPVQQLPLLTDAEYHQIVHQWNDTAVDFDEPQTIHMLFEQQVERTPDAIALIFEDTQLTYAELNARANQLAHHLISLGVQPDILVAVAIERSMEMVVGLLAAHRPHLPFRAHPLYAEYHQIVLHRFCLRNRISQALPCRIWITPGISSPLTR